MPCTEAYREHIKDLTEHLAMSWVLGDNGDTKGMQGRARAIRLIYTCGLFIAMQQ